MCQHCDDLHKARIPGDDEHDIWRPHESAFIRWLVEKWTSSGLDRFGALRAELSQWVEGTAPRRTAKVPSRPSMMSRWSPEKIVASRLYLQSIPIDTFTIDDWMLLVDYLVYRYLPDDAVIKEAQWQVARASMMGRVQANMAAISAAAAGRLAEAMPSTIPATAKQFGLPDIQRQVIEFGQARCCQYVTNVTESVRGRLKAAIVGWQEQQFQGVPSVIAKRDLQGTLLDNFADLNRDWRRIAITESGEAANQGLIASLPVGTMVKRIEQYHGACDYCRSIDGKVYTVVSPDKPDKDGDTEIWAGKNNYGRSGAARKRTSEGMVDRLPSELWWAPTGLVHPNCRGRLVVLGDMKVLDQRLADWIKEHKK